nr:hypothetical protein BaRGS_003883 [Batillaria attramentaria]
MVMELRRVTLLWEELWLGTLAQHHADVQRRLSQLETEIRKVNTNSALSKADKAAIIREKHRTIMKPTLYTMERLHEITSQPPETPHEVWFQNAYGEMIRNALDRLRNPSNPSHPHASWHLFKQVYISLQQRAQKRGSLHLKMEEISPKLAVLSKSLIPMPGLGLPGQMVTVEKVCNTVQILPTKTKPKKMVFIGSDGKRHPYLFKGLEDLHLDERIMQFLSIVNNMFTSSSKGQGSRMQYRARHYSVTPLGPRSGLIQWVEGATPLFGLYKKWQQREAYAQTLKGIETTDNRKEWPLTVLRKVLEDLMDDTPDDLLAKELWCASAGPGEWWQMVQTYSRSTAVMSMIGYIIGLGDRHLDNVLVDLATGEVVHIDYNVCFEKGKNLRVPERVPFRMTQNIETALGVTGVEVSNEGGYTGAFYGGETAALGAGGEAEKSKKEMEQEITISMFAIRCAEMKSAWVKNREEIMVALPELQASVGVWVLGLDNLEAGQQALGSLQAVQRVLVDASADPSHSLYTLGDRYADYAVVKGTKEEVMLAVEEKIAEFAHWQQIHKCDQLEAEMVTQLKQRRSLLHSTMDILHSYSSIVAQFGVAFANNNRAHQLLGFLQELVCDFSSTKCEEITAHFQDLYGPQVSQSSQCQLVLLTENRLENIIAEANNRLLKLLERRGQDSATVVVHEMSLHDAEASILAFLQETGSAGEKSLMCFIVSALSSLSKRYLLMESASAGAGERLMDLTSRDGDWFLEELCSISGNVNHFLDTLERNTSVHIIDKFKDLHSALRATYDVYIAIQDLNLNFRSIILPEALKLIQSQEPSILASLSHLESLVGESTQSLESLVTQLEIMHRNVIMGVQTDGTDVLCKVQQMQIAFNQLLQDTRSLLSALFFLKRLQAMQEFFHMVTQLAAALQGLNGGAVYDDEQMAKPIKKFIAEFVRKQMIGFPSQLLGCVTCLLVESLGAPGDGDVIVEGRVPEVAGAAGTFPVASRGHSLLLLAASPCHATTFTGGSHVGHEEAQEAVIAGCKERYASLEGGVVQRLRWAAGANPSLNVTLQLFQDASMARAQLLEEESGLVNEVASLCQGILHFEAWRTRTQDALATDNAFLSMLNSTNSLKNRLYLIDRVFSSSINFQSVAVSATTLDLTI